MAAPTVGKLCDQQTAQHVKCKGQVFKSEFRYWLVTSGRMRIQNAMEFMMTYGWAILVLIVVLAALYSIGAFRGLTSQTLCSFPANIGCEGAVLFSNGLVQVNIQQSTPDTVNIVSIACNNNQGTNPFTVVSPQQTVPVGGNVTLTVQCYQSGVQYSGNIGASYKGFLVVNYTDLSTGFTYTSSGSLIESVSVAGVPVPTCTTSPYTFNNFGINSVVVPANCGHATFTLKGAGGGGTNGLSGGTGGYIQATNVVIPGSTLYFWVGSGGLNAGTAGSPGGGTGVGGAGGGGGGGCSAVSTSSSSTWTVSGASALLIAAGGGGASGAGPGGQGGGLTGSAGAQAWGGGGGTQTAGGAGGVGTGGGATTGGSGSAYTGGSSPNAGAGACGYYGGGGGGTGAGAPGGGGGGSSWNSITVTGVTNTAGGGSAGGSSAVNGANGVVIFTWGN